MKKLLLFVLSLCFALVTTAADLNPFAYGLSSEYDPSTFTLTINYSLNAPATSVDLVIIDSNGAEAGRIALPGKTKGTFSSVKADLSTVGLVGGEYSWKLDVTCNARSANYEPIGRVKKLQSPFSVDVDNNPNSRYFGQIYVSQPTTNTTRGIYVYKPGFTATIGNYMGSGISVNTSESWYSGTHAVPYRIRVVQDGTGRILVTSCDKDQSTHLWLIKDPAHMTIWSQVITSSHLKTWTGHNATNNFANISLDIRKSDNGQNWELLLYSATVDKSSTNFSAGYVYSGIYTVPITTTDFTGGTYTNLTKATIQSGELVQDATISGKWTGSMITANAQLDKFGGVLYSSYSLGTNPTSPSFIHRTKNGTYKKDYANEHYLYRENVATAATRFNHDFTRLAIAQGSLEKEARFYTVTQAQASDHIALSARKACDMIPSDIDTGSEKAYVIDFAWDYASNIYAVVRNGTYAIYGVYAMAANLGGAAVSTPARAEYKFNVECPDVHRTVTINGQVEGSAVNTNLGECVLKIDGVASSWNTTLTRQSCTQLTVTAVLDDKHKFIGWYDGETCLTKNIGYTFYTVKDITLTAKFEFAEYNVTWHNLLANTENVLGYDMDNNKLWELFMPYFNDYNLTYTNAFTSHKNNIRYSQNINAALTFIDGTYAIDYVSNVMTNTRSQLKWLGDYLISVANKQGKTITTAKDWRANICAFFKKESKPTNASGVHDSSYGTSADYTSTGDPTAWLPYYSNVVGGLPLVKTYGTPMPVIINELDELQTTSHDGLVGRPQYPTWYNSNVDGKLLAWYYGDDVDKKIVHDVYKDGALYATWVEKRLQEDDPDDEASNEDVIKLMKNTNHTTETESFTVTRKLVGGMYNTICMPFTLRLEGLMNTHPLYGAKAYDFTGINPLYNEDTNEPVTVLNFTEVNTLEAGKPYLIMPLKNVTEDMLFTGVSRTDLTLEPQSKTVIYGDNELKISFHGVINPTDIRAGALMVVANNRLAVNTQDYSTMAGMRGYFTIDFTSLAAEDLLEQAQNGRVYLSMRKPTTTSVPLAPEAEQPAQPKVQKIMRNGKIYILRGDEIYTITGARVR